MRAGCPAFHSAARTGRPPVHEAHFAQVEHELARGSASTNGAGRQLLGLDSSAHHQRGRCSSVTRVILNIRLTDVGTTEGQIVRHGKSLRSGTDRLPANLRETARDGS